MDWNRFLRFGLFCSALIVLFACVVVGTLLHTQSLRVSVSENELLYIESGDSVREIAKKAKQTGLVSREWHFIAAVRTMGLQHSLRTGEFEVVQGLHINELVNKIAQGAVHFRKVVIPEGASVAQVEEILLGAPGLTWAQYEPPIEGSLLPETYFYTRGDSASALVARMQENMDATLTALWTKRSPSAVVRSKEEAIILASIVEKETGIGSERPLVSAVFSNRIKKKMRLQSDPTVVYGITYGQPLGRRLTRSDLQASTPYNTYRINGLPPTAIANPGRAALEAVLNPAIVPYLYFVADGTGGHKFANTLREHNKNVANWRRIRDAGK